MLQEHQTKANLREVCLAFLRLGTLSFGGPAAHIAMMENEFVQKRQWLERGKFLELVGASNLIPGPTSTELAIYNEVQKLTLSSCTFFIAKYGLIMVLHTTVLKVNNMEIIVKKDES